MLPHEIRIDIIEVEEGYDVTLSHGGQTLIRRLTHQQIKDAGGQTKAVNSLALAWCKELTPPEPEPEEEPIADGA